MFVHHLVTICLLVFSWSCNLVRIGTLVLLIHDFADIPLQVFMSTFIELNKFFFFKFLVCKINDIYEKTKNC